MIKKSLVVLMALLMTGVIAKAQQQETGQNLDYNVISTAVPFMSIAPDARSAGMGDIGVSTSPDVYSMHWNPAKYAFMEDDFSIGLAYSPWLRKLVPDMNIAYLAVSKRVSSKSTIAGSLKYFSLGEINFRDEYNNDKGTYSPNEFAVDLCYSRKLGDYFSASVAARFIYSHLTRVLRIIQELHGRWLPTLQCITSVQCISALSTVCLHGVLQSPIWVAK